MKTSLKAILIALFFLFQSIFSQDYDPAEIYIYNNSTAVLYVSLYPISSVFDKPYPSSTPKFKLFTSLNPGLYLYGNPRPNELDGPRIIYLVGLDGYALTHNQDRPGYYKLNPGARLYVDIKEGCGSCEALIGHGIYSLEFYENQEPFMGLLGSPIIIDYSDLNYRYGSGLGGHSDVTLFITYVNYQTAELRANFQWSTPGEDELPIGDEIDLYDQNLPSDDRGKIKCYRQYTHHISGYNWEGFFATPNSGDIHGISDNDFLLYPIDGKLLPPPYSNTYSQHVNPGLLVSPLNIDYNHQSKMNCGKSFEISYGNTMKLLGNSSNQNTRFFVGDNSGQTCNTFFKVSGTLLLHPFSQFIVEKSNSLSLGCSSSVIISNNAKLIMQSGSKICFGGSITKSGQLVIQENVRQCLVGCPVSGDALFGDSIKVVLQDSAALEIPDSTTFTFEGSETALLCDSGSTIKLGKASKLVFTDGARIKAKHTKFTSLDSTETWNGIYISDKSFDTLQYCIIENAVNGINIENNYSYINPATAAEISNCVFSNTTQTQLLNMVYINNCLSRPRKSRQKNS